MRYFGLIALLIASLAWAEDVQYCIMESYGGVQPADKYQGYVPSRFMMSINSKDGVVTFGGGIPFSDGEYPMFYRKVDDLLVIRGDLYQTMGTFDLRRNRLTLAVIRKDPEEVIGIIAKCENF